MHQIPTILKIVGFLKESTNGDEYHPTGLFSLGKWPGQFSFFSLSLNKYIFFE